MSLDENHPLAQARRWLAEDERPTTPIEDMRAAFEGVASSLEEYRSDAALHARIAEHSDHHTIEELEAASNCLSELHHIVDVLVHAVAGYSHDETDVAGHLRAGLNLMLGVDALSARVCSARAEQRMRTESAA